MIGPTDWEAVLPDMEFIPHIKALCAALFFDQRSTRKDCEAFLKERFEIVQSEIIPTRKIPRITDEPIIWRYFVDPLKSVLSSMQLDEKEFVARTVMKINAEMKGAYVFSTGKNMGAFKAVGFPEDVGMFYQLENMKAIPGRRMDVIPQTHPAGGAAHIRLLCWIILLYTTVKFHPTMQTAALSKCLAINARCKPILKSSLIFWIILYAFRG